MSIFPCKFPIMQAAMNQGTSVNLAIAVHQAGAMPSLSGYQYRMQQFLDTGRLSHDLETFKEKTGTSNINISIDYDDFDSPNFKEFVKCVAKHKVSHIEIIPWGEAVRDNGQMLFRLGKVAPGFKLLTGAKILVRMHTIFELPARIKSLVDGWILKGSEAGGMRGSHTSKEGFHLMKELNPDVNLIVAGGVTTAETVEYYLKNGASGVAIGTLFAATTESPLALEAKKAFVQRTSKSMTVLPELNQNAIKFDELDGPDDINRTRSLVSGLYVKPGQVGHAFVGATSLDAVTDIISVQQLVNTLTSTIV